MLREGDDITICAWGTQIHVVKEAAQIAAEELDVSVEVIDLGTISEKIPSVYTRSDHMNVSLCTKKVLDILKSLNPSMGQRNNL